MNVNIPAQINILALQKFAREQGYELHADKRGGLYFKKPETNLNTSRSMRFLGKVWADMRRFKNV